MRIRSYRDLDVWQKALDLVVACYGLTRVLPHEEDYVLKIQIRRSVVSIPSNSVNSQRSVLFPDTI